MSAPLQIGLLLFPKVTQLDLTGPLQVFSSVPGEIELRHFWKQQKTDLKRRGHDKGLSISLDPRILP